MRLPSFSQWRQLPRVLTLKEKLVLTICCVLFAGSSFLLAKNWYFSQTHMQPAQGGQLTEGMVGFPHFLNPVYSDANDVDRDLVQLIFSGLLSYDGDGKIVPDLAKDFPTIGEEGRVFTLHLKENVKWHDGTPFTAEDVLYTIRTIQDPQYKSPIRANWIGVEVEKITDFTIQMRLVEPYAPFGERLTLKILPAHLWNKVTPQNFPLSPYNLQPVGTGPYRVAKVFQEKSGSIKEIRLESYPLYHANPPFLQSLIMKFFPDEEQLLKEASRGQLQTFQLSSHAQLANVKNSSLVSYTFPFPRYFAIFFNLEAPDTKDTIQNKAVRKALEAALDKNAIVNKVFEGKAKTVSSPLLPSLFGFPEPQQVQTHDKEKALFLLSQQGFTQKEGTIGKALPPTFSLQSDLVLGDENAKVKILQECLAKDSQVYPEGVVNGIFGSLTRQAVIRFQEKYTGELLSPLGLTKGTGKVGPLTREKLNSLCFADREDFIPLTVRLATIDQSPLNQVAQIIKEQWEELGLKVEIQMYARGDLEREIIKPRQYQALLFGEVLGKIPDPFPFWHSSQKKDPGLNLSSYENKKVDLLLEKARKEMETEKRVRFYEEMQEIILEDTPAIFLYDVESIYVAPKELNGIKTSVLSDPSQRFAGITEWYVQTKRVWK